MTFEKVRKLIAEQLDIKEEKISLESKLVEDLGADSLDVVEMLMTLEEEFSVTIEDDDMESLKTVEAICNLIDQK